MNKFCVSHMHNSKPTFATLVCIYIYLDICIHKLNGRNRCQPFPGLADNAVLFSISLAILMTALRAALETMHWRWESPINLSLGATTWERGLPLLRDKPLLSLLGKK